MVLRRMLERAGYTNLQTINDSSLAVERFVSLRARPARARPPHADARTASR